MLPRDPLGGVPGPSRRFVLGLRVALLAFAATALLGAVVAALGHGAGGGDARVRYVCPMHAEVSSAEPGLCPICHMDLEPLTIAAASAIKASTYQAYDTVRSRGYGPDTRAPAAVDDDGAVTAILYADELAPRGGEQRGVFYASSAGGGVEVRSALDPPAAWDRSTVRVRFRPQSGAAPLRVGDAGWIKLAVRQREAPVIASSAILEGADGPYVLVASPGLRTLTKRPVVVGRGFGGFTAILSGLGASERVLIRSAFFVDAERRLRQSDAVEVAP